MKNEVMAPEEFGLLQGQTLDLTVHYDTYAHLHTRYTAMRSALREAKHKTTAPTKYGELFHCGKCKEIYIILHDALGETK